MKSNDFSVSKAAVSKWCNGQRIPRKTEMRQIHKATSGEVCPNDFYL
jgi:DNA-binding transcriptional regulator YdaS (Cro superfamily)